MTKADGKVGFPQPATQEILGGEIGYTAHQIAEGLGVPVKKIHEKIKRGKYANHPRLLAIPYTTLNNNNGLTFESYIFNIDAAKAFVARWVNHVGDGFLLHLINCEKQLIEEVKKKSLPKKRSYKVKVVQSRTMQQTLFGEWVENIQEEKVEFSQTTKEQRVDWEMSRRLKTAQTHLKKVDELRKNIIPIPRQRRIK